jgi:hypothetical protein
VRLAGAEEYAVGHDHRGVATRFQETQEERKEDRNTYTLFDLENGVPTDVNGERNPRIFED